MLQREGLVVAEPNRRVRIATLSAADAEELYLSRVALESAAARITVPTLASPQIAELEGYVAEMEHFARKHDHCGLQKPHKAFHAILVAAAGKQAIDLISRLCDHAERYRANVGPTLLDRGAEHRAILEAAAAGDGEATVRELIKHHGRTAALVFASLDGKYNPGRLRSALAALAPGSERSLRLVPHDRAKTDRPDRPGLSR